MTLLVTDSTFQGHSVGDLSPESPQRYVRTLAHLKSLPWFNDLSRASAETAPWQYIESNHSEEYLTRLKEGVAAGLPFIDSQDVPVRADSVDVARKAVGAGLSGIDHMMKGDCDNAFILSRPPGHHAENHMAMGFCLFNNIAIAARYAQSQYGVERIAIVDWDVHHGNGTQHSFYDDPSILFVSTHQMPLYPGTGAEDETGEGDGVGFTLNIPMKSGDGDDRYHTTFDKDIIDRIRQFEPQLILVSAGFDAHVSDPLASLRLSTEAFGWMTQQLVNLAAEVCEGRLVSFLEGGYNLDYLPQNVARHVEALAQFKPE